MFTVSLNLNTDVHGTHLPALENQGTNGVWSSQLLVLVVLVISSLKLSYFMKKLNNGKTVVVTYILAEALV